MSDGDGLWFTIAVVGAAGYFAYQAYWAEPETPESLVIESEITKPTVDMIITALDNKTVWMLDVSSVKGPRTARIGWVIQDHSNDNSTPYRTSKDMWKVNCDTTAYSNPSRVSYDKDGEVKNSWDIPSDELVDKFAIPDSNGAAVVDAICSPIFDPKPPTAKLPAE
jgi:hypothetical protein